MSSIQILLTIFDLLRTFHRWPILRTGQSGSLFKPMMEGA